MATKDHCLLFQNKHETYGVNASNGQYSNLNLNQNKQCFLENTVMSTTKCAAINESKKFVSERTAAVIKSLDTYDSQKKREDYFRDKLMKDLPPNFREYEKQKETYRKEFGSREKNENKNNSTLSLHITAYENSIENTSDVLKNGDENAKNKDEKGLTKKWKNVKTLVSDSAVRAVFELPRQQKGNKANNPEVMQFKASQRLFNPNQAPPSEREMPGTKEVLKMTPEVVAHHPVGLSDEYIFFRIKQWMDDGDKGVTFNHIMSRFKTYPSRAQWLLNKFYFDNRDFYKLRRGWFIESEANEEMDDDGIPTVQTGRTATEAEVEEMEKDGKVLRKKLFCIHPVALDSIERIDFFNSQRMDSEARTPLSVIYQSEAAAVQKEKEAADRKEAIKLKKLFEKECERPKHTDPTGKNKYKTPQKAKDDFFSPARKNKDATADKPSPLKARRRMDFEKKVSPKNDPMMDDVFTTGDDDDVDMEDFGRNTNELVDNNKPMKPAKIAASNYRPKNVSSRVRGYPGIAADAINEEDEDMNEEAEEPEAGPSTAPMRIKELRTVQETTRDDEGFLVTSTSKKMVETDKVVAPPLQKKKTANPPASKKAKPAPKQQSTLTDFFKRK